MASILMTFLTTLPTSALVARRPPLSMACVAIDQAGVVREFEFEFRSAVRRFNLFESDGTAQIGLGPFPLLQVHVDKPAFGFEHARYEVRLGTKGEAPDSVDTSHGVLGRFGEARVQQGSVSGRGFQIVASRGSERLDLTCARMR